MTAASYRFWTSNVYWIWTGSERVGIQLATHQEVPQIDVQLACFELGERTLGIDVREVREIVRDQPATPLPHAPELIEGVVDLRGRIVPVVDLGRALEGRAVEISNATRLVLVEAAGLTLGLRVAGAADVLTLPAASVEAPPALVTRAGCEAVRAVVRRDGAPPLLVLSLEALIESVYRSANGEAT